MIIDQPAHPFFQSCAANYIARNLIDMLHSISRPSALFAALREQEN